MRQPKAHPTIVEPDLRGGDRKPGLQVALLGAPAILWGGGTIEIPRRQVRALLYRLSASLQPIPREQLCFLFWPDTSYPEARRKLTHLLTHLGMALPYP